MGKNLVNTERSPRGKKHSTNGLFSFSFATVQYIP